TARGLCSMKTPSRFETVPAGTSRARRRGSSSSHPQARGSCGRPAQAGGGEVMDTQGKTEALLGAIERRLSEISERQHALAVEKAWLVEQTTPLRLGVTSPDLALAQLKAKGITLRGLAAA